MSIEEGERRRSSDPHANVKAWIMAFDQYFAASWASHIGRAGETSGDRYSVLRSLVGQPFLGMLYDYTVTRAAKGSMRTDDQVPGTPSAYGDPVMEELLQRVLPRIEMAVGVPLFPTYSYLRVYKNGDLLKRHVDRPSCEVSVSLTLGYNAPSPWPISIQAEFGEVSISLEAGDALLYRGMEVEHWRDEFKGVLVSQVFLHYVCQDGPHASAKFDMRARLDSLSNLLRSVGGVSQEHSPTRLLET